MKTKRKKGFIGPLQASLDLVRDSRRKTFILGFAVTLHTIFDLLQQDFIESFFSLIRLHGGWDNNPAPHQIKYIMRKLIVMQCGGVTASLNTNCIAPPTFVEYEVDIEEDENSAACLQIAIDAAEILENNHYLEASGQSCEDRLGNFKCKDALCSSNEDLLHPELQRLILAKGEGKLQIPSKSVYLVVKKAEEFFRIVVGFRKVPQSDQVLVIF